MSHPVPPPKLPAIVQNLPPQMPSDGSRVKSPVVVSQSTTANSSASPKTRESTTPKPTTDTAKSAAILGSEVGVGYPVEQFEVINDDTGFVKAATPVKPAPPSSSVESRNRAIAALKKALATSKRQQRQTNLARSQKPIPAFRPSTSVVVNQRLVSQIVAPPTPTNRPLNNASESPFQPQEIDFQAPAPKEQRPSKPSQATPQPSSQPAGTAPARRIVEVSSDRQEYDAQRQIITAEGNVTVRIEDAVLDADRLQVSLPNLIAVGEGNVAFTRGQQVLRGQRFTYNIVQNTGNVQNGSGAIYIPTASADFSDTLPTDVTAGRIAPRPLSDRITANQPLQNVSGAGGTNIVFGAGGRGRNIPGLQEGGDVRRLRFEANQINFYPEGWKANDVRITNDPFSPPELELRANTVTLTRETPLRDRIRTTGQRLVFDQGLSLPVPRNQAVIDRTERESSPGLFQLGYDGVDRGGLYIERGFPILNNEAVQFNLKPQFYVQRSVEEGVDPSAFGLRANLRANAGPRTALTGIATFTNLDLDQFEDNFRSSLRLQQLVGTRLPHTVSLEYSYRDRLYNGTLGYQDVQSSIGALVTSPAIPLGDTGIALSYQAGFQYVNADTDRLELLEPDRENNRTSLSRFQGSFALDRRFPIWQGQALPATREAGLRYTPAPVVPYLAAIAGVRGTSSFYSNGDNQSVLIGTIGLEGQIGHLSRSFLDYTAFNIRYSDGLRDGISPFLFDRAADTRVIDFGFTQQIYGPLLVGFQTAINLENNETLSTDYILEYRRRTYGILLRYNPELEIGSIGLRISDFNWSGGADPFSNNEVRPVVGGVRQ